MSRRKYKSAITDVVHGGAIIRNYEQPSRDDEFQIYLNKKLNRAIGKLEGVRKMLSADRPCVEIAMQLSAIQSTVRSIESAFLQEYLQNVAIHQAGKGNTTVYEELDLILKMYR